MKRNARNAYKALVKLGAPVFEFYSDGSPVKNGPYSPHFKISGEDNYPEVWADYWDGYSSFGWDFGVNPKIEAILEKNGLRCEWENAGVLGVYNA